MKAISLWQPWAWLLCHGHEHANGKRVENRKWPLPASMVGKWCLIHASKRYDRAEWDAAEEGCLLLGLRGLVNLEEADRQYGGILGAVKWMGDYHLAGDLSWRGLGHGPHDLPNGWGAWAAGPHCWLTMSAKPLPFVPWRGQQGFFDVPLAELPAEYQWLEAA